jgi:predicted  nucleic acid-binding Zn-ribbon protein
MEELSDNVNKAIENFNGVAKAINMKDKDYSDNTKRIEDSISALSSQYEMAMTNMKETAANLGAVDNEIQEKLDKLNETVYSSLPSINSFSDDINELKKYKIDSESKFDKVINTVNSLTVEINGLNLKMETVSSEFENIQKGINDTQNHINDFMNGARSTLSTVTSYNPAELVIELRKTQDNTEVISGEIEKIMDTNNNLSKSLTELSNRVNSLSVVKNAAKLFENVENVSKNVEESENRINSQTSTIEVMFNQINSNMNKFIDLSTKINDLNKRLSEMEGTVNKINGGLSLFATKDDIVEMQNRLYSQNTKK